MPSFASFQQNIHEMLSHLYDPVFRPPELLWQTLGVPRERGMQELRDLLLWGIEALKPSAAVPHTARAWRTYGLLRYRYVEDLSQEATAERLGITARHLRRIAPEAVHALSMVLWEHAGANLPAPQAGEPERTRPPLATAGTAAAGEMQAAASQDGEEAAEPGPAGSGPAEVSWEEQLARELEALHETAAGAVSTVAEVIASALRLAAHLARQRGIALSTEPVSPRLMAAIHPSALRQILLLVIDELARQMEGGAIRIAALGENGTARIAITGHLPGQGAAPRPGEAVFNSIGELLSSFNIGMALRQQAGQFEVRLSLLQVDRCVLVVDDNMDMAHLYRRYLAGTRYYLHHVNRGEKTFEAIEQVFPDLVMLDVMLPDMDGWDLLTRLHENPATRPLPVMIASVMREQELAYALGARYYLTKPIQRQELLRALDEVLQAG